MRLSSSRKCSLDLVFFLIDTYTSDDQMNSDFGDIQATTNKKLKVNFVDSNDSHGV